MGDNKLCYGCMENTDNSEVCPKCGYNRNSVNPSSYLAAGTVLSSRYLVGKLVHHNGESAEYIAYDKTLSCKILLKEYMPENLCTRDKNGLQINANHNNKVQYKALMDEFTELNRSIARMRTITHITPVTDIFSANNTSYAVFEYTEGLTLLEYLKENAGELTWAQVSKLFPPFFTTLSLIHNAGIVHRGISPETIMVTSKGELRINSFSISALRTVNTELNSELFHGYSAPEQYSLSSWQGTWTDVYGISAVLYRILTGCRPTEAQTRLSNDSLCPPCEINTNISEKISDTIMKGLALKSEDRIQTVTELVTQLFEQETEPDKTSSQSTMIMEIPSYKPHEKKKPVNNNPAVKRKPKNYEKISVAPVRDAETVSVLDKIKVPLMIGVLLIAILLVIGIICMAFFADGGNGNIDLSIYNNSAINTDNVIEMTGDVSDMTLTGTPDSDMPQLIGYKYDEISESSTFIGWLTIEPEYEYNDKVAKGIIMEQSIAPGEKFISGSTVIVKVSKGPASVEIPNYMLTSYSSYKYEDYFKLLDELGIEYEPKPEVNWNYADGYVIGISINGERVKGGDMINMKLGQVLEVKYTDNYKNSQTYFVKETTEAADADGSAHVTSKVNVWVTAAATVTKAPAVTQPPATQATQPPATQAPEPVVTQAPEPVVTQAPEPPPPQDNDNNADADNNE
ncbi:MAG: PASTA domain-containing protein [Oscillospiraceae bacterium]